MLKGYEEGSFIRGTGLSFGNLQKQQKTRKDSLTSKIIDDPRCVTLQNTMHEKTPKSNEIDSGNRCSTPRKKNYKKVTVSNSAPRNKWIESNKELFEDECEQRHDINSVKRSAELQQTINNVKRDHTKINLIERKIFELSQMPMGAEESVKWKLLNLLNALVKFSIKRTLHAGA